MRVINQAPGLLPYIIGAAIVASGLNYCIQSVEARLNAPDRIAVQNEPVQAMHIVDRSHKGDRLPGSQSVQDQAAADGTAVAFPTMAPRSILRLSPGPRTELPDGCESAFSPMSAAEQKKFAARCLT
jgi:hypothetical protein